MADSWIICETSGRWAAALRASLARPAADRTHAKMPHRIHEVRHFGELQTSCGQRRFSLGLLEVQRDNLAAALSFLSSNRPPALPIVALLHESLQDDTRGEHTSPNSYQFAADALREAGALATVDSPRRISALFDLSQTLAATHSRASAKAGARPSFVEWAQRALPWQDE